MELHKLFYAFIICACVIQTVTCQENKKNKDDEGKGDSLQYNKEDVKNLVKSFKPIFDKFSNPIMGILQWSIILELIGLPFAQALSNGKIKSPSDFKTLAESFADFVKNIPLRDVTSLLSTLNKALPNAENLDLDSIGSFLEKLANVVQDIGKILQKALDKTKN